MPDRAVVDDDVIEDDCPCCGGFYALYAMTHRKPCPDCGRGKPGGKMVLTDNPYVAGALLDEWSNGDA